MTLQDILAVKGSTVFWIKPEATLGEAVQLLVERRVGALLVCREEDCGPLPLGIVTERDLLYAQASGKTPFDRFHVSEVMTARLITGLPDDSVEQVMGLMTTKRIRHLPVVAEGRLLGIISIGDLVKSQLDRLAMENRFLQDYIAGER